MSAQPTIKSCYVFGNGMVMTFDQHGQQMPEYQGPRAEVLGKIRAVYSGPIEGMIWDNVRDAMLEADRKAEERKP